MSKTDSPTLFERPPAAVVDGTGDRVPPQPATRRRLLAEGASGLSDGELLAIILGRGTRDPSTEDLRLAGDVLRETGGLYGLRRAPARRLMRVPGVAEARACVLAAAAELGARLASARAPDRPIVSSPDDVHALLAPAMAGLDKETFVAVLLNTKNAVLATPTISIGTLSAALVHPREFFRPALEAPAHAVIAAHNHPSGDPAPSHEDREMTKRLAQAGKILGIELLDHVIVGHGSYRSMKQDGAI